jgi:hypothetical protein
VKVETAAVVEAAVVAGMQPDVARQAARARAATEAGPGGRAPRDRLSERFIVSLLRTRARAVGPTRILPGRDDRPASPRLQGGSVARRAATSM